MSYRALYRVWRPRQFSDLVGQEHVTQTLTNALNEGHLSHAYLFTGPRGTGKTSAAKLLAKAVNCELGPDAEPCNRCEACRLISEGALMDVVEIDAASNRGVDEIRDLRDKVKYAPSEVRYKVYIIDEVHMLTTEAFNALLKTLEEPPGHVIFILATTEPHKLPATIISRCQRFSFQRFTIETIVKRLKTICQAENISYEESALSFIARVADGGMRDALSLLDQSLAFGGDGLKESAVLSVTGSASSENLYHILASVKDGDISAALTRLNQIIRSGIEPEKVISDLVQAVRDILLFQTAPGLLEAQVPFLSEDEGKNHLTATPTTQLTDILNVLIDYQQKMKWSSHPRILLEMLIIELANFTLREHRADIHEMNQLLEKVSQLERTVAALEKQPPQLRTEEHKKAKSVSETHSNSTTPTPKSRLDKKWLEDRSDVQLDKVRSIWGDLLQRVKVERITVHAWLIDGEPVAATDNTVLVVFKSKIHRETTDKPANKKMIEHILSDLLGVKTQLLTCMSDEWENINPKKKVSNDSKRDEIEVNHTANTLKNDIVSLAIEIFGEKMVEVQAS
ncbi:DNA polymerase III subunit gamma/tau [Hazenella sp. IB182357]|uniref:DNA-directed DNA polymerase n=1 Tax=Polycladospora coralii TaxID=2771432 RepID=A0A926N5N0_9BACL|nr:DNA polymerase III subunit gamma/tau [Polycladospora coralii]MBD1371944.1 DNA polymerase III subunit gamma/tau [Polycladospora coralii]